MTPFGFAATAALIVGLTLVFGSLSWFQRPSVAERLTTFHPGAERRRHPTALSVESFRDVIGPLTTTAGARLGHLFGVKDDLAERLARIHAPIDAATFRLRQFAWMAAGLVATTAVALLLPIPDAGRFAIAVAAPVLMFLLFEQRLSHRIDQRRAVLLAELPVIAEQLGMLLSAGFSLGAAIGRLADRSSGVCSDDLRRVRRRIQQGLTDIDALREWANTMNAPALDRLVSVLALNHQAADLGVLISNEARSIRAQAHRDLVASIERRTQQVWIPVTVATLLPGVIFMAIPFVEALSLFSTNG